MKFNFVILLSLALTSFAVQAQVEHGNCGNGANKNEACGMLARYAAPDGQFLMIFRMTDEKDRIKEGANTAQSYIHIDTDTEYTERVTWTNYSSPVTMHQLNDALSNAVVGFTKTEPAQTIQGTFYPARTHDVRIESRRNITVAGQAGLEITANDDYSKNGFFRVFPVGHRLYLLSVVSDATEDPDVATNNHKIEVERFFNSLKQVPAPQGKLSNK